MSKKTFQLISGIVGGVQAIAVAVVTYTSPEFATAINGAIVIVGTAVIEACRTKRNETLQALCRDYLGKLRYMAKKHGIDVDSIILANKRNKYVAT